jgi:hypothetical protein
MVQFLVMAFCIWSWLTLLPSFAQEPQEMVNPPSAPPPGPQMPLVENMSQAEGLAIFERHAAELKQLPGVVAVWLEADGIHVYTHNPAVLPTEVEGLPVMAVTSLGDGKAQKEVSPLPDGQCGPGTHWDAEVKRCKRTVPLPVPPPVYLPPPPGVIVLRPGGVREQAESCPEGFNEIVERGDWHFCVDPGHPETIPLMMVPPIAGIPYEECLAILERHREELHQIPGVQGTGLGAEGIVVETDNPALLPSEVEGLPIKAEPPRLRREADHSIFRGRSRVGARGFFFVPAKKTLDG